MSFGCSHTMLIRRRHRKSVTSTHITIGSLPSRATSANIAGKHWRHDSNNCSPVRTSVASESHGRVLSGLRLVAVADPLQLLNDDALGVPGPSSLGFRTGVGQE